MIEDDYQEGGECPVCEAVFWATVGFALVMLGSGIVQFISWRQS